MIYIEIDTSNAAFQDESGEIERIISTISSGNLPKNLRDINGNTVGKAGYTNDRFNRLYFKVESLRNSLLKGECIKDNLNKLLKDFEII